MNTFTGSVVQQAAVASLQILEYDVLHAPDIGREGLTAERED
ncbi:MAG: hypothetical protein U9Q79_09180 [Candidatus Hydrogenedentes bacterium]|nr:hypothetical protein [Candidatus Hydrogenedentota bacterium]